MRSRLMVSFVALAFGACATGPQPELTADQVVSLSDDKVDGDTPRYVNFKGELPRVSAPVALDVRISDQLAYLADNRGDRPVGSASLRSGFATGGFLGSRDLARLLTETEAELVEELTSRGVVIDASAPTTLRVVLVDALPNSPTFNQISEQPSLSSRSFGEGGASFEGTLVDASGQSLGQFTYGFYETLDRFGFNRRGIWTDADRAISRFANRIAKKLA